MNTVKYRSKGQVSCWKPVDGFQQVLVLDEDGYSAVLVPEADWPSGELDLTGVPVIFLRGRRAGLEGARAFLADKDHAGWQGAFLWGAYSGSVLVTDPEILQGKKISGGRPEIRFTNHRWLRDGRYVADHAKMLHGKVLEVLEAEVELEPGAEALAKKLAQRWSSGIQTPLAKMFQGVVEQVSDLTNRLYQETGEVEAAEALCSAALQEKFESLGIVRYAQVPEDFEFESAEVAPDLWAMRQTLGRVDIPGLGMVDLADRQVGHRTVKLSVEQIRKVTDWPATGVLIKCVDFNRTFGIGVGWNEVLIQHPLMQIGPGRWAAIREEIAESWLVYQRQRNFTKDQTAVADPREVEVILPEPQEWGTTLDGEPLLAYPALEETYASYWQIKWYVSKAEADEANAQAKGKIASLTMTRDVLAAVEAGTIAEADILRSFGGYFRVMGFTSQSQYWVVTPEGILREPDSSSFRRGYSLEGEKLWVIVCPRELAISWFKSNTGSDHEFVVNHLPVEGCTAAQFAAVEKLEDEIAARWEGKTGMSGKASPDIGGGWNLRGKNSSSSGTRPSGPVFEALFAAGLVDEDGQPV